MEEPIRYYTGNEQSKAGDRHTVWGWYEKQEWVWIELVRLTSFGWLVKRAEKTI